MIAANLPALQVVLPLLAAPLCVMLRRGILAYSVALIVTVLSFIISLNLLIQVWQDGSISYLMGGWAAPWGIEYRVDILNAFILFIVSGIGLFTIPYAYASVQKEIPADRHAAFYSMYLLCLTGSLGIAITGDAFNIFVFLEIASLSTYTLISMGKSRRALTASFNYLVLGTVGATFILIGIGLLYDVTGTLNIADLAERLKVHEDNRTVLTAFAFLIVGISLKVALFPLHLWLPNAYTFAPSFVTAFLAATATKVSVYVLLRFTYTILGGDFAYQEQPTSLFFIVLSLIGIFAASTVAIFQNDVKRLLAYSSVAQIGYIILGIGIGNQDGVTAAIAHLFNHAVTKGALFMALGCVAYKIGSTHIKDLRGIGKKMPWTMMTFVFGGLSLIGVPFTAGFISKWYLILAALDRGWWIIAAALLLASLLAVIYVWRVIEVAWFKKPEGVDSLDDIQMDEAPLSLLIPTWALIGVVIFFGIYSEAISSVSIRAAQMLLGGAQ